MFLSIVGARSAEQYGITRGQNLLTPTSYGFSMKTYKIDVKGKYKIYRNRILPMLRIPNRQNPRPQRYHMEFSVQKIPAREK